MRYAYESESQSLIPKELSTYRVCSLAVGSENLYRKINDKQNTKHCKIIYEVWVAVGSQARDISLKSLGGEEDENCF